MCKIKSKSQHSIPQVFLAKNSENIKLVAYFLLFKQCFPNSVIYNYTAETCNKRTQIGKFTTDRIVKKFLKLGWATKINGNINLASYRELAGKERYSRYQFSATSIEEIINKLRLQILKNKATQIKCARLFLRDAKNAKLLKINRKKQILCETDKLRVSLKCIAKLFNVSVTTAHRIIKELESKDLILVERFKICSRYMSLKEWTIYRDHKLDGEFFYKNRIFYQGTNSYTLSLNS